MPINLTYYHSAENVPKKTFEAAVVIDVLRATTTIAWALYNGAEAVQAFSDINKLKDISSKWPKEKRLILGERGGRKLEGFDLGNSPLSVSRDIVEKKRIFISTTNGTKALQRLGGSENLFAMSLPNRKSVAERIIKLDVSNLVVLGSGWEGDYSLEDSLAAGALAGYLQNSDKCKVNIANDEMNSALALWSYWNKDILKCLKNSTHGQRLMNLGEYEEDLICCSQLDNLTVVPKQTELGILKAS
tara:strand:- start:14969 stop:15703 length:735 start_codon:yes stop_codon:yes gene_type:complete